VSTDYYRPIANAVSRLRPNTLSARRSIYDQARQLLFEEAQQSKPPMGVSELIAEQRALEDAIQMVEAENVFDENAAAFEAPPRSRPPVRPRVPAERPAAAPSRTRAATPPEPEYGDYEYEEPQQPLDPRERLAAERAARARQQDQRRLDAEERRAQRQAPRPRQAQQRQPGRGISPTVIIAAALAVLFLVGGGAAYVSIFGWPSFRAAQQPQQKKDEALAAQQAAEAAAKAQALFERGSKSLESGDPATAVQLLTEAIVLAPKNADAFTLRGHSYLQAGDPQRAIEDFSEAIKLGSRDFYAFSGRAVAYRRMRDFPRSIADYNEAIKLRPDHPGIWNNRCFVRAITGDLDNALADCNESLRLSPSEHTLDSRALVYLKQGKWDLAIADYDAVLKISPNTLSALYGRGFAKLKKGDKRGQADIATATAAAPTIAQEFERYGVK
jgi:tetratricopeptide (TPR) repeat protein